MGTKRSRKGEGRETLRDRLAHIRACEKAGGSLKAYAERHGLSVHPLYQAKKIARQRGLLPPYASEGARRPVKKKSSPGLFAEAVVVRPRDLGVGPTWRLRLASGDVLEGHSPLERGELVHLLRALRGNS